MTVTARDICTIPGRVSTPIAPPSGPCGAVWRLPGRPWPRPVTLQRTDFPMRRHAMIPVLLPLLLAVGCEGFLTPRPVESVAEDDLTVIRVAPDAPPLMATEASFWAVRGEAREVEIRYDAASGYNGKCLRFVVPANALLRNADGSVIAPGDSVLITVRVTDPALFLFEFEPAGLRFDPSHPARLEVRYRWRDETQPTPATFGIWRQERGGAPWVQLPSTRFDEMDEIHADIGGFTRFAVAFTRYALASD